MIWDIQNGWHKLELFCALKELQDWIWHTVCQKLWEKGNLRGMLRDSCITAIIQTPYGHSWIDSFFKVQSYVGIHHRVFLPCKNQLITDRLCEKFGWNKDRFLQTAHVQVGDCVIITKEVNTTLSFPSHFMMFPNHLHFHVKFYK